MRIKKVREMNGIEKIAYRNIKGVFDSQIGEWYNCIQDNCIEYIPDSEAEAKDIIYEESLNDFAEPGRYAIGRAPKEMRFAGEAFIRECIDHLFKKDGDIAEIRHEKWELDSRKEG